MVAFADAPPVRRLDRFVRRLLGSAAIVVAALHLATWLWGVSAVRHDLRGAQVRELKSEFRDMWAKASPQEIAEFDRQMDGLRFETDRAIPVLPGILWV